jgi:SAM-dependent methyltransferase
MKHPNRYGDQWADTYDEYTATLALDPSIAVDFLYGLAGAGPVLELGIGTGRIGLPLAARGLNVHGIEASRSMIQRLQLKPGSENIIVHQLDYSNFILPHRYSLVFGPFNAICMLLVVDDQINCFKCVSDVLEPGGRFVIEADVPDLGIRRVNVAASSLGARELQVAVHHRASQQVISHHFLSEGGTVKVRSIIMRYASHSQLDLMAKTAGLELDSAIGSAPRSCLVLALTHLFM